MEAATALEGGLAWGWGGGDKGWGGGQGGKSDKRGGRGEDKEREDAYSAPLKKIPETATFLLLEIDKFQIRHIGTKNISISDATLNPADTVYSTKTFKQWPGWSLFQIFERGWQASWGTIR